MSDYDDIIDSYEEDEEDTSQQERKNPVRSLREALKAKEKEARNLAKELKELQVFKAEYDQKEKIRSLAETFTQVGLTDKHAELFYKLNPEAEATVESVSAFANDYQLPLKLENSENETPSADNKPFIPASGGSADETGYVSREQLDQMYAENPRKAIEVLQSGKVKWNNPDV